LASFDDVDLAVKTIKKIHNKFAILKCTSSYPAVEQDLNLKTIQLLKKKYRCHNYLKIFNTSLLLPDRF
jgi:pseudaminic acid synthase